MLLGAIGFVLGLLFCQQLAQLPSILWVLLLLVFMPALFITSNKVVKVMVWGLVGFLWSLFYAHLLMDSLLKPELEGKDLIVTGTVSSIPHNSGNRTRFRFSVSRLSFVSGPENSVEDIPDTLLLNWYKNPPLLKIGDPLRLHVKLKRAHGYMNPGGFDYESWVFRQRINAVGYVKRRLDFDDISTHPSLSVGVDRARQTILETQFASLADSSFHGILAALTIGDRNGISNEQWRVLTKTGTNHLMAISGLHIGLVSGLIFFLMRYLWGYFPNLINRLAAPRAAAIFSMVSAVAYAALAGFSIPTQRALIMVSVVMLGVLLNRRIVAMQTLLMALFFVLLANPLAVLSAGFWLSFSAVAAILFALNQRVSNRGLWVNYGKVQFVTFVGLAPFLIVYFQKISLIAPIANVVAVPWMSVVTIPLTLLGSLLLIPLPEIASVLLNIAHLSLLILWPFLTWLADFQFSSVSLVMPSVWVFLLALVGVICLLAPSGMPSKWIAIFFFMPVLLSSADRKTPEYGKAIFTLLDVGQGLSVVVQTSQHVLIYDTGPKYSAKFDTGKAVIMPYLQELGIDRINTLIVSHGDNDHIGGADSVIKNIPIETILTSIPSKIDANKASNCVKNTQWEWDGVKFSILHPDFTNQLPFQARQPQYQPKRKQYSGNNTSCVLLIETAFDSALIAGDIEADVENILVNESKRGLLDIRADVLVVPHHGSKTSSKPAFIDAVKPKYALFAVGYRNRYGFPKPEIVERYLQRDVELFDTSQYGAIIFILGDATGVASPELYRNSVRRYWHTMPLVKQRYGK